MAKTFKNLPPGAPATFKPASEQDFFDLSDGRAAAGNPPHGRAVYEADQPAAGRGSRAPARPAAPAEPGPAAQPEAVRQTFVLGRDYLEQLRDYVHARRSQGDYAYSQRQALQEALDLLFAGTLPVPPRPAQVRAQEQAQRQRIRRDRLTPPGE